MWFLSALCLAGTSVSAQDVKYPTEFPVAAETAGKAAGRFSARAEAVVALNACGREIDYLRIRAAMERGDYSGQGEGLTSILIAKLAWLSYRTTPCTAAIPVKPEDLFGEFAPWVAKNRCAVETGRSSDRNPMILTVSVDTACMRREVNESIMAMVKDSRLGSSDLPCAQTFRSASKGEWDVNVRELVRILYMAGTGSRRADGPSWLDDQTIDHMYANLLAASGPPGPGSHSVLAGCDEAGEELGSPEDRADRHAWYNEMLDGITDFFKWLFETAFKATTQAIALAAAPVLVPFLLIGGGDPAELLMPTFDVRVAETENHRLMIETSRYLTNADIIARLQDKNYDTDLIDDLKEDQLQVRVWLLLRLQDIAKNDFIEYNARPYSRYSLEAISNLYDFAGVHDDTELRTAAQIVLDLSAAKFAIGSNRGRRIAPFRRRSGEDGTSGATEDLYNYTQGGDHEVARALVLAGQTQLLRYGWMGEKGNASGVLVNTAVSTYRLPVPVAEVMIERTQPAGRKELLSQHMRHVGAEVYFRSPAFTVSAGGLRSGPAYTVFGRSKAEAHGTAMPTVIIPTNSAARMQDLFGFKGTGTGHERTENLCAWFGFACGMTPQISELFTPCISNRSSVGAMTTMFVNSANCNQFAESPFFLAVRFVDCDGTLCGAGRSWGLMEIVNAPQAFTPAETAARDALYAAFRQARHAAFDAAKPDAEGRGVYVTAAGEQISYEMNESRPIVTHVNGIEQSYDATAGDVITADRRGVASIVSPSGARVDIDYTDWRHPKRKP